MPSLPAIRLHQAVPASGLRRLAERDPDGFGTPYWAYRWGGGLVLARYLLDHPELVAGRRVLDLGSGSGLVAIAAARCGAVCTAIDIDPYAAAAIALNAAANDVVLTIVVDDPLDGAVPDCELILVGDLFYDEATAARVTGWLDRAVAAGRQVLVGDPGRAYLPHDRLRALAEHVVDERGEARTATIFAFG